MISQPIFCWISIVITLICCSACDSSSNHELTYGANQSFRLENGEVEMPTSKSRIDIYESLCVPTELSLPINRIIQSKNYVLYISFADTALPVQNYIATLKSDTATAVIGDRATTLDTLAAHALIFRRNGTFVTQYWRPAVVPGMQEVFVVTTIDSTLADKVYQDNQFIGKRIQSASD
jgi:hypothetical protein